jgi:hypothetical protein
VSLGDLQHVEAAAIMRELLSWVEIDCDELRAAEVWLKENRPSPEVYMNAMNEAALQNRSGNPA